MVAAQSHGVYTETVVCTDRCGSNKGQPEDEKTYKGPDFPADMFFSGVICSALI